MGSNPAAGTTIYTARMSLSASLLLMGMAVPIVAAIVLLARLHKKRRLSLHDSRRIAEAWQRIGEIADPAKQILEADKVLHLALSTLGYAGSTGEMLRHAEKRLSQPNSVWRAHKLRNALAHELDVQVRKRESNTAMRAYAVALKDLGMR